MAVSVGNNKAVWLAQFCRNDGPDLSSGEALGRVEMLTEGRAVGSAVSVRVCVCVWKGAEGGLKQAEQPCGIACSDRV